METYKNVKWNEKLSVGYNVIDGHHKKLILIVEEVYSLLELPDAVFRLKVGKVLKKLSDYTIYHFQEEERVMAKYNYPGLEKHAKIHATFVEKLQNALPLMARGDKKIAIDMYNFLSQWLLNHIAIEDQDWAKFIHEKYPDEAF